MKVVAIGQGGGPTPVINASVAGALDALQQEGIKTFGLKNGIEALLSPNNIVDISNWSSHDLITRPGSALGTTRIKLDPEKNPRDSEKICLMLDTMKKLGIGGLIVFGGNDTAYDLKQIAKFNGNVRLVHGSKTIDNDLGSDGDSLSVIHHSPGFGSAALFNAIALRNLALDIGSDASKAMGPVTFY